MVRTPSPCLAPMSGRVRTKKHSLLSRLKSYPFSRLIRRAHLYLGLLLVPWVLLFGITALSFNHPTIARGLRTESLSAQQLGRLSNFKPLNPNELAQEVTASLGKGEYSLVDGSPEFSGWPLFARPAPGGLEVVIVNLEGRGATLTKRLKEPGARPAPFSGEEVDLKQVDLNDIASSLEPIHERLGIKTLGPLRPHAKVHPELRFVVRSSDGHRYNAVYDLASQVVQGVNSQDPSPGPVIELLESMHKQHHYPVSGGITFVWALFLDLLACTLIFWALSGLYMWWKMKKLRLYGLLTLGLAVVLSATIMAKTAEHLSFLPQGEEL